MNLLMVFFAPFFVGILLVPVFIKLSERSGKFVDRADEEDYLKIHNKDISLLGGPAMFVAAFVGFSLFIFSDFWLKISAVFVGAFFIFMLMLYDDLKWKKTKDSKPLLKFIFLVLAALLSAGILFFAGIKVNFFPYGAAAIFLNFIYIFLFVNSVNYQDGMDGQAGGLLAISFIGFGILGFISNDNLVLAVSMVSLAAVLSFLIFNFPPAKIFMGDSGAYFLGFILSVLAMNFSKPWNIASVLGPIFIAGLPIFDGIFTNLRRIAAGKSIIAGDRGHFYDRLLQKGYSAKKTLLIYCLLQTFFAILGIIIYEI